MTNSKAKFESVRLVLTGLIHIIKGGVCVCVCVCVCVLVSQSCLTLCNPIDCSQAPPSMEFSRQEYWKLATPLSRRSS